MNSKHVLLAAFVIVSSVLTRAQVAPQEVRHFTNGGGFEGGEVTIWGAEGDMNMSTGQIDFVGPVSVRPTHMPLTVEVQATNAAGAPFPSPEPIAMSLRGPFDLTIGKLVLHAAEADLDGRTGRMELRGNVRVTVATTR